MLLYRNSGDLVSLTVVTVALSPTTADPNQTLPAALQTK